MMFSQFHMQKHHESLQDNQPNQPTGPKFKDFFNDAYVTLVNSPHNMDVIARRKRMKSMDLYIPIHFGKEIDLIDFQERSPLQCAYPSIKGV